MRTTLSKALFGAVVTAALGFGVSTASAAAPSEATAAAPCPGYMSSAQACRDCCAGYYGAYGIYNSSNRYCNCAL